MKPQKKLKILTAVFLVSFFASGMNLNAQSASKDYLDNVKIYSRLYSGQVAQRYNAVKYKNTPYFAGNQYSAGTVVFNDVEYNNVPMFLDLYKQQLLVLNTNNYAIIVPEQNVQKVVLHGNIFVWLNATSENALKTNGYYISYFSGEKLDLLCEESFFITDEKITPLTFDSKEKYYLQKDGKYYRINGKSDIIKHFPNDKKQITDFVKAQRLDFGNAKTQSLIALVSMCDKL